MSYYASCGGSIVIHSGNHIRQIEAALKEVGYDFDAVETGNMRDGEPMIKYDICFSDNYHDDDVWAFLEAMEPFADSGSLVFKGEDGSVWRFIFRDGHFVEENAEYYFITEDDIEKTERVLVDNGIDPDEAQIVLQAIGYTLLDKELYPNV